MLKGLNAAQVLIVGAGTTGLALGINLLRAGVACRIIERRTDQHVRRRGLVLHTRTVEILDAMGVRRAVEARAQRYHAVELYGNHRSGRARPLLGLAFRELDSPFDYILGCPQPQLEAVLEERFRSLGGELLRATELLGFRQDGSRVRSCVQHDGTRAYLESDWLVGCDGADSLVRRQLDLPFAGRDEEEHFLFADVDWSVDLARDRLHGFLVDDGPLTALPLQRGWRLAVAMPPRGSEIESAARRPDRADMTPFYQRIRAALGAAAPLPGEPRWLSRFAIRRGLIDAYRCDRVLLAGDACHVQSPVGAQGLNTGIGDAFNLAWKLALLCRGRGGETLLDSYQGERRPVAVDALDNVGVLSRATPAQAGLVRGARNSWLRVAGRPRMSRRLLRRAGQLDIDYRHSPLVAAGPDAELGRRHQGPLPGDRVPDARLLSQYSGTERHLRGLLHQPVHHLLLQPTEQPDHRTRVIVHALLMRLPDEYLDLLRVTVVSAGDFALQERSVAVGRVHLWRDQRGEFRRRFGSEGHLWLMRPDGYLAYRAPLVDADYLLAFLERLFGVRR